MTLRKAKLAFYGDDFTGATDTLSTIACAGYRTMLFLGIPTGQQLVDAGPLDCLGIAGAARSMDRLQQKAELVSVGRLLHDVAATVTHYKTCSTFDSSPSTGSIGAAVQILGEQLDLASFVPIVGGQPNLGRYCVFGNVFAAFQTGSAAFRLDRHPTMSQHPVTPMNEADLRLHLAEQGLKSVGLIEYPNYQLEQTEFDNLLDRVIAASSDGVLFDVGQTEHLAIVGKAIWQRACQRSLLAVGPSSVAQALIAHWKELGMGGHQHTAQAINRANRPVFIMSGSRSPVTSRQIEAAVSYQHIPLDPFILSGNDHVARDALLAQVLQALVQGRNVLAYVPSESAQKPPIAASALAEACGRFLSHVLAHSSPSRIGVAGGDTSSLALKALDVWGLSYIGQIDPGVALCQMHSDLPHLSGVEVMLKGGQMGSDSVFEKLISPC